MEFSVCFATDPIKITMRSKVEESCSIMIGRYEFGKFAVEKDRRYSWTEGAICNKLWNNIIISAAKMAKITEEIKNNAITNGIFKLRLQNCIIGNVKYAKNTPIEIG